MGVVPEQSIETKNKTAAVTLISWACCILNVHHVAHWQLRHTMWYNLRSWVPEDSVFELVPEPYYSDEYLSRRLGGNAAQSWRAWQTFRSCRQWGTGGGTTAASQRTCSQSTHSLLLPFSHQTTHSGWLLAAAVATGAVAAAAVRLGAAAS